MSTEIDIHPIQSSILCQLLFKREIRFSDLDREGLTTDHFSFHLRQLRDWGLIEKGDSGKYCLTSKGKEFANRFDTEKAEVERQPKIGVLVVPIRGKEYLMQQRLKQPYFGFWGFVTGKVRWGETVEEAALRELMEETGLKGEVKMMGIKHKMDYSAKGELLEDKYFLVFRASKLEGKVMKKFEGGKNVWMIREKIMKLTDLFDGVAESIELIDKATFEFDERKWKVKGYSPT